MPIIRSLSWCAAAVCLGHAAGQSLARQTPDPTRHAAPRLWTAAGLEGWATPVAGLGVPPTYYTEEVYYAAPVDNLRTYPVYHPDREPRGYRESLLERGPLPLIEVGLERTQAEWIEAGQRVFEELDDPGSRSDDPAVLAHFTDAKAVDAYRDPGRDVITADGVMLDYRWVVDQDRRLKLSFSSCAGCHTRLMPGGGTLAGAPCNFDLSQSPAVGVMLKQIRIAPDLPRGQRFYAEFGVPWAGPDPHLPLRDMPDKELAAFLAQDDGAPTGTVFARFNGSPLYATRMADLRGIRHRRYLDATATHANRGPEDVARYGILVEYADAAVFGPHRMVPEAPIRRRPPDDAMYAMALYLYSLEPPPSPHPMDARAIRGRDIFEAEGCIRCHTPPHYTNNKLVPVPGFDPPRDDPRAALLDISNRRVHTDPGLALKTRKGTGYYKIPSLRGLWYRGLFGHCGFMTTLEEWFDPARLREDFIPSGWRGPGVKTLAIPGHDFGLDLSEEDRAALIAFLRTL